MSVDDELRDLAEQAAQRYHDATLAAAGWTRQDLVDAIHTRLRTNSYRSKAAARRAQRFRRLPTGEKERLYPYRCTCGAWHLTHQTPRRTP